MAKKAEQVEVVVEKAEKAPEQKQTKPELVAGLRIVAAVGKGKSFRRAGHKFDSSPKEIELSALTEAQIFQMKKEPKLAVVETMIEKPL